MTNSKTLTTLDIRAEVLLMEWIDRSASIDIDDISMIPDGGFNHMVRREVSAIEELNDFATDKKYAIHLARKWIYDALPANLIHQQSQSAKQLTAESRNAHIKKHREEEIEARKLFRPFDQNFNRYRLKLEKEERKVLTGFPVSSSHTLFDILWGQFDIEMTNYQKSILFSILPMAHEIAGNIDQTTRVFEAMINQPVCIQPYYCPSQEKTKCNGSLGDLKLSAGMILGNVSDEQQLNYKVEIQNIPASRVTSFLPDGNQSKLLNMLVGYFIPFEISVTFQHEIVSSELELLPRNPESMANDALDGQHRLGYSIHL